MFCQAFSSATEFSAATHNPLPARHSTCAASPVTSKTRLRISLNYVLVHIVQTNLSFPAVVDSGSPNADTKMPVQRERCLGPTVLVSIKRLPRNSGDPNCQPEFGGGGWLNLSADRYRSRLKISSPKARWEYYQPCF